MNQGRRKELPMNIRVKLPAIALVAIPFFAGSAIAERIPVGRNTEDKVVGECIQKGGAGWDRQSGTKTYGCINKDGSGIVCGGTTEEEKKTCDTFRKIPLHIPTRFEAELENKAEQAVDVPAPPSGFQVK
jgi:hypothetical protein